ncbi:MAG: DUF1800 domain-containing protein [Pseudomonadota bacterium]
MLMSEHAERRFGLGPRAGQPPAGAPADDPAVSLLRQLDRFNPRPAMIAAAPSRQTIARATADYLDTLRANGVIGNDGNVSRPNSMSQQNGAALNREIRKFIGRSALDFYAGSVNARIDSATQSDTGFAERLVHFWANHFAVSVEKPLVLGFAGLHEFEAIRPNIMGRFADLLKAASLHPAMLIYLDQIQSIGPDSVAARFVNRRRNNRQRGLNENLAREILELHSLGVRGGYDQNDVVQLAHALTGWTVSGLSRGRLAQRLNLDGNYGAAAFAEPLHQPGTAQVMGRRYSQSGAGQSLAILDDLAVHPSTARHIATKLARHFAADDPPSSLVNQLEEDFLKTGGDLASLYRRLVNAPEVWQAKGKYTTPWEWAVAASRIHRGTALPAKHLLNMMRRMGQQPWRPGSPAGFGDQQSDWLGPDTLFKRVEVSRLIAGRTPADLDVPTLARQIFPQSLSASTALELSRAESSRQAYAMLLMSPEFLRR